ncbi:MAG: hypothetical protein KAS23_16745 [Anaerohalosphaera sp.]|nr:hypothetical protein [Anaerohalosphaera sp.]
MENRIDTLRAQIDEISGLIGDTVIDGFGHEAVSDKYSRLGQMILRMQDGDLERRYVLRFEQWLLSDNDALEYYVRFSDISAGLRMILGNKIGQFAVAVSN